MLEDAASIRKNKFKFRKWLETKSYSESYAYKEHIVDVLDFWLNGKMGMGIGCLFRFDDWREYETLKLSIVTSPVFKEVCLKDQNGRPLAAVNHYSDYLSMFARGQLKTELSPKEIKPRQKRVLTGTFKK